jgi:hypothetical protein
LASANYVSGELPACYAGRRLFAVDPKPAPNEPAARTLTGMATKTKAKMKTCVHCGHTFDPDERWRDLADPEWLPAASTYCSQYCSDRYHCEMTHCCSTNVKKKA